RGKETESKWDKGKVDGIPNLVQIAEGCRRLSSQASVAAFAAVTPLRFFVSENSSEVETAAKG
ncbi:hypothetical protein EVA_16738, partial [gut metagenome]